MRVGFLTQLLWTRYGPFWQRLVVGSGAEACFPEEERIVRVLADERLSEIPGVAFRLAAAQALALAETDLIVAPDLNPGETRERGGGQDPWIASFPEALATTLGGLPPLFAVPATLEESVETLAINFLHTLSRDPALVRRVWDRNRTGAKPPRYGEPRWTLLPSERATVGVIGQPWNLNDALVDALRTDEQHVVSQHEFPPALLREEGWRGDERLIATDAETLGAARFLGRRGSVSRLVMVIDSGSGSDAWLARGVARATHKPLETRPLQELLTPDTFVHTLV